MTIQYTDEFVAKAAQAIRDANGTPEALAAWKQHPQLVPADIYARAVLAVVAAELEAKTNLRGWWVCTGFIDRGGEKVLGPFADREEAIVNRIHLERLLGTATYFVDEEVAKPLN